MEGFENMSLPLVKNFLINQDLNAKRILQGIEVFLKQQLSEISGHEEKRLEILFYLLLTKLRIFSVETPEVKMYFSQFRTQIDIITRSILRDSQGNDMPAQQKMSVSGWLFKRVDFRLHVLNNKIQMIQMRAFLGVAEYYLHTLEQSYRQLGISDRIMELYIMRMDMKRYHHLANRRMGGYFGLEFFRAISLYGTSLVRLAITCSVSLLFFAGIYWLADAVAPIDKRMIKDLYDVSDYLFNSLATITGLGIDASPVTALQRIAMGINALYGMIVMGMLFNVISTKLSMNN